jgi:hypothetical protein
MYTFKGVEVKEPENHSCKLVNATYTDEFQTAAS